MKSVRVSGTENYAREAPELLKRYESISFADAHAPVLQLIPPAPCRALDIGACLKYRPKREIALAKLSNLYCTLNREAESSLRQPGVSWTRLAFHKTTPVGI